MAKRAKKTALIAALLAAVFAHYPARAGAAEEKAEDVCEAFNRFCIENFGAEKEPLVYEKFGRDLKFLKDGSWMHVSENSACIAWETNLPAKAYVEYGETKKYSSRTPVQERHFCIHIHYLKGLKPGTTYHYRLVSTDERGNRIMSEDATFEAKNLNNAVRIPGDRKAPFVLDKAGATYLVTKDIVADGPAFDIRAGITLDLGGHTVVYNEKPAAGKKMICGLVPSRVGLECRIYNGTIKQGAGNDAGRTNSGDFSPIYAWGLKGEIAGVTVVYSGVHLTGLFTRYSKGLHIHHNIVEDRGFKITNRHKGTDAIKGGMKIHHNLVKRARHRGISFGSEVYGNEIYCDSFATNGACVTYYAAKNVKCHDNRLFGTGYALIGVSVVASGTRNVKVTSNFVHLASMGKTKRWKEYGPGSNMSGLRMCSYENGKVDNIEYSGNTVVVSGKGGGKQRGLWVYPSKGTTNVFFNNNIIKATGDSKTPGAVAICVNGEALPGIPPVFYRNNTVISNFCNVRFGGGYGSSGNSRFVSNVFVREGNNQRYKTVRNGYWIYDSAGNVFLDSSFKGGAGFDKASFEGGEVGKGKNAHCKGERDFTVQWYLTVKTAPGAKITIKDKTGKEVFSGEAGVDGKARAALSQYIHKGKTKPKRDSKWTTDSEKIYFTPHTVAVEKNGGKKTVKAVMDKSKEIELKL